MVAVGLLCGGLSPVKRERGPLRSLSRDRAAAGFTLVELLVVLAILGLLVGLAVPQLFKYFARAKQDAAQVQIETVASGLDLFMLDAGRYPTEQEGLRALIEAPAGAARWRGPYLSKAAILTDPWGHAYVYRNAGGPSAYDLHSLGPDGAGASVHQAPEPDTP